MAEIIRKTTNINARSLFKFDSLPTWSKGRVALIGDAAHGTSPWTGQGTSIALEDAMYLAKMLKEHDFSDAYYYFEDDRKQRIDSIFKKFENPDQFFMEMGNELSSYKIQWNDEEVYSLK
ncbi:FAD-dependent oxidoreductase [Bacillus gaemokensis]|uniref:FAD-dependent oxidoreductase n=1 Tax=Bacillus gaemokensis TaxID=574375 RepID=UPI000AC31A9E|nr:FAD-dependent monooxygenase [Bacillus gaemokensis]